MEEWKARVSVEKVDKNRSEEGLQIVVGGSRIQAQALFRRSTTLYVLE